MKKATGKELPKVLDRRLRMCPQCGGVGWNDNAAGVARCVRCSGFGVVKLAQAKPPEDDIPADVPSGTPAEPSPSADAVGDFDDSLLEGTLADEAPSEDSIPPQQLKSDIASMLSSSFSHTVAAVFEHVAGFDTEMSAEMKAKYAGQDQRMVSYIYKRLDAMTPEQLRSTFKVFRK